MKRVNIYTLVFLLFTTCGFLSCEDEVTKSDYDPDSSWTSSDVLTYDVKDVGANYAIIEGTKKSTDDSCGILVADNVDLFDAKIYAIDEEGDFSIIVPALTPNTTYYFTSYLTDSINIKGFGEKKSFTTEDGVIAFFLDYQISDKSDWESFGFSFIDKDGDGNNWSFVEDGNTLVSYSWYNEALTPENYLLFPKMEYNGTNGIFSFKIQAADPDWYAETVKVVVSKEPITEENCRDAEVIFRHTLENGNIYSADINIPESYEGGDIYFAIVHTDVTDNFAVYFLGASFIYQ